MGEYPLSEVFNSAGALKISDFEILRFRDFVNHKISKFLNSAICGVMISDVWSIKMVIRDSAISDFWVYQIPKSLNLEISNYLEISDFEILRFRDFVKS
jgi:hypothetical protein